MQSMCDVNGLRASDQVGPSPWALLPLTGLRLGTWYCTNDLLATVSFMLPTVSLQCDLGHSRWYGLEEHAERALWNEHFPPVGVAEHSLSMRVWMSFSPSRLYQGTPSLWGSCVSGKHSSVPRSLRVSGATRVNRHNCEDCPKADGKQRLNGIENRCEAWFKLHFIGCCSLKRRDCFTVCFHTVGSCCLFCVHSRILPKKERPPHLVVFEAWRLSLNCRAWVRNMAWLAVGLLCILCGSEPRSHLQILKGQISFPSTSFLPLSPGIWK